MIKIHPKFRVRVIFNHVGCARSTLRHPQSVPAQPEGAPRPGMQPESHDTSGHQHLCHRLREKVRHHKEYIHWSYFCCSISGRWEVRMMRQSLFRPQSLVNRHWRRTAARVLRQPQQCPQELRRRDQLSHHHPLASWPRRRHTWCSGAAWLEGEKFETFPLIFNILPVIWTFFLDRAKLNVFSLAWFAHKLSSFQF